jgi:hypothetical protein
VRTVDKQNISVLRFTSIVAEKSAIVRDCKRR